MRMSTTWYSGDLGATLTTITGRLPHHRHRPPPSPITPLFVTSRRSFEHLSIPAPSIRRFHHLSICQFRLPFNFRFRAPSIAEDLGFPIPPPVPAMEAVHRAIGRLLPWVYLPPLSSALCSLFARS